MLKSVIVFAVLLVVNVLANPLSSTRSNSVVSLIALEEDCVRQGGVCVYREDCDSADTVLHTILCPKQAHNGVVCCYS